MKRDWFGLAIIIGLAIVAVLSTHRAAVYEERITVLEVRLEEEIERADEAESRIWWSIREMETMP